MPSSLGHIVDAGFAGSFWWMIALCAVVCVLVIENQLVAGDGSI